MTKRQVDRLAEKIHRKSGWIAVISRERPAMAETVREEMLEHAIDAISDHARENFANLIAEIKRLKAARKEWIKAAEAACNSRDKFRRLLEEIAAQRTSIELGPKYQGDFKYGYDRLIEIARRVGDLARNMEAKIS